MYRCLTGMVAGLRLYYYFEYTYIVFLRLLYRPQRLVTQAKERG